MTGQLTREIEEIQRFIEFVKRTGRLERIEYIDKHKAQKTPKCIHILQDFSAVATRNHEESAKHLKRLHTTYKSFREHALDCKRCQHSLDAIFSFIGYENKALFPQTIQTILEKEWKYDSDKKLYLCKLTAANFAPSELTYVSPFRLEKAVGEFRDKISHPLNLPKFGKPRARRKISSNGLGISYVQAYLSPEDHRYKTKISIRSLVK